MIGGAQPICAKRLHHLHDCSSQRQLRADPMRSVQRIRQIFDMQVNTETWLEELKNGDIESGKEYTITYVIDEKGLNDAVGLELVTTYTTADGKQHVYSVEPFSVVKKEGDLYTFQVKHSLSNAGSFKVSYRMFPKNPELPHRQDFCYVRWFI